MSNKMKVDDLKVSTTDRGFSIVEFDDYDGVKCSLQQSSLATESAIWLGCNKAEPKQLIHGKGWQDVAMPPQFIANTRMHLTQEQVAAILPYLKKFSKTGAF